MAELVDHAGAEPEVRAVWIQLDAMPKRPASHTKKPDGTVVRTLWGEITWQLGGK